MRKYLSAAIILALIASLFVAGCGGGTEEAKPGGVESRIKDIDEKVLEGESGLKSVAEAYRSSASTQTLTGIIDFAEAQEKELTTLGLEAANLAAGVEEAEAEPVNKAVEMISEAKSLMEELAKAAETSQKALEAPKPDASKYLDTIADVKEAIAATEEFYKKAKEEGGE